MDNLKQFKEWKCSCNKCKKMCDRPCFGTVQDIKNLIKAGYSDRLCLDWNSAPSDKNTDITFLTPALKDCEGKLSPSFPSSIKGCTFLTDGLCALHSLKLKPLQGRTAIHGFADERLNAKNDSQSEAVKEYIMQDWKSKEGQDLVDAWCKEHNIKSKYRVLNPNEFMAQALEYFNQK